MNLDEKANLPYWNYEYPPIPNDLRDRCDQIILGTDTLNSVALNYNDRVTIMASTGPTSIVIDSSGNWLGLYYAGYGDNYVVCIDWLHSSLPHRDISIEYNPYGSSVIPDGT